MIEKLRRTCMLIVKSLIDTLPSTLKIKLRKNALLTSFYSQSLQKSGLFYGFPTPKQRQALYDSNLKQQTAIISKYSESQDDAFNLVVIIPSFVEEKLDITIKSCLKQKVRFQNLTVMTRAQDLLKVKKYFSSFSNDFCSIEHTSDVANLIGEISLLFIIQGDVLHNKCTLVLANEIDDSTQLAYVDTDFLDSNGERYQAEFYPEWNEDLQISTCYIRTGIWLRNMTKGIANKIEVLNSELDIGLLPLTVNQSQKRCLIQRIPLVLVHRTMESRVYNNSFLKGLTRLYGKEPIFSINKQFDIVKVEWPVKASALVSLIIPTKNAKELVKNCIESILHKSTYQNFEILLIDNNSDDLDCIEYFKHLSKHKKIRVYKYEGDFNYSAINNFAAMHAKGEVLGLINNDIVVIEPKWLDLMMGHVLREDVGCVGAKLLYSDGRIQHAGVVMGYGGGAGHAHKYFPRMHSGYLKRLVATQSYSAVTAACLLIKKQDYDEVGGLNEVDLKIAFNDVDLCLRVLELGKKNVFCAESILYHLESVSRGLEDTSAKRQRFETELYYLQSKWKKYIDNDPAYNPNLTLKRENFAIAGKNEKSNIY